MRATIARVRERYLTARGMLLVKLLISSLFFLLFMLAMPLVVLWIVLGSASEDKEQPFYKAIDSPTTFRLRELFQSEQYCISPGGIGNDPRNYLLRNFPNVKASEARPYDSQDDWFIILLSGNTAEINPIRYELANLENEEAICGPNILIIVDHERTVRAVAK